MSKDAKRVVAMSAMIIKVHKMTAHFGMEVAVWLIIEFGSSVLRNIVCRPGVG